MTSPAHTPVPSLAEQLTDCRATYEASVKRLQGQNRELLRVLRDVLAMLESPKFSGWIEVNCSDDELWAMTGAMLQRAETIRAAIARAEGGKE